MSFSRDNPSPRFLQLVDFYKQMHDGGTGKLAAAATFDGVSLAPHIQRITTIVKTFKSKSLLDYGSGKATIYGRKAFPIGKGTKMGTLQEYWGLDRVQFYDPGYEPYATLPDDRFDAVISTDVMEHIPEEDVAWVADEMLGYARHFVYACVALYPARKLLPDGSNAHVTLKEPAWWVAQFDARRKAMMQQAPDGKAPHFYLVFFRDANDPDPLALTSNR